MAAAVAVFKDNLVERLRLASAQEEQRGRAEEDKRKSLVAMADEVEVETNQALDQVGQHTNTMTKTAEEMSASADRTRTSADSAGIAATQALTNAETVSSAAEQLSASIHEIGTQVAQSTTVVSRAVQTGQEAQVRIETLNQQVGRVGAVADMISAIAAKTNLLALNATIEAARAGDAGKGFAVVASEVKQLATQTAQSTKEINRHLDEIRAATGASVDAVTSIEHTVGEVSAIAGAIAAAVEEQSAATAAISGNIAQTATAAKQMAQRIEEVAHEANQTGQHAAEVRANAIGLNQQVDGLRHTVTHVVRTSTTEVDRRSGARNPVSLPCQIDAGGKSIAGEVTDLSVGGAAVRCETPLEPNARGTLVLERVATPFAFIVVTCANGVLRLAFRLETAAKVELQAIVDRLAPRSAT